ncbi:hypothetical protein [Cellulomonas sp. HZM]|uniref:hypothetical protein n=1 Tax=Cellulomonas sp. HZM TaxID=1454010 RepID=UPI00049344DE|nr:hypothetical protein [Cellulomonas sp. HZM]
MVILVGVVVALLVAAGVLLLASVMSTPRAVDESPWQAFRAGWAARKDPDAAAVAAAEAEPVDVSLVDMLRSTADDGDAYLHVEELSEGLHRARERAARAIPGLHRS